MVDRERRDRGADARELTERHHGAAGGFRIDAAERIGAELVAGIDLEDDVVLIEGRVDPRHVTLAEGVVEKGIDHGGIDAEARSDLAVDLDSQRPTGALLIAGDIGELRQSLQLLQQKRRPVIELVAVHVDQRVLVLRLGQPRADIDVLRGLHVERDALDRLQRPVQPRDHLVGGGVPLRHAA